MAQEFQHRFLTMIFNALKPFYWSLLYTFLTAHVPFWAYADEVHRGDISTTCEAALSNRRAIVWQRATDYELKDLAHETNVQLEIITKHMGIPSSSIRVIEDGSDAGNAIFKDELRSAVSALDSQERPELFLSIFSHGGFDSIYSTRSGHNEMSYGDLSKIVADAVLSVPGLAEKMRLHICFHGCHSFSFFEYLQKMPTETFFAATASVAMEAKPKISIRELEWLARWLREAFSRPIGVDDIALLQNLAYEFPRGGFVNSQRTRFSLAEILLLTQHIPDIYEHGFQFASKMGDLLSKEEFEIWFHAAIQDKDPRVNTIALVSVEPKQQFDEWKPIFLKINPNFQTFVLRRLRSEYIFLPWDFIAELRQGAEGLLAAELNNVYWKPRQ